MSMRKKYSGSVVRANPVVPTEDSAPGIWTLEQQNQNQKKGTWPFIGDPSFKNTTLLLHGDTSQTPSKDDQSGFNQDVEIVGDAKATNFSPYNLPDGYWSNFFDGSSDFEFSSSTDFNITTYVTFECWVYFPTFQSVSNELIAGREANYWLGYSYAAIGGTANKFVFTIHNNSSWQAVSSSTTPTANTWYHIMGVKDGTTLRFYLNGTQENTATFSGSPRNSAYALGVGGYDGGSESMTGYVSNVRLVTGSSDSIFPYSLAGGSSFTPPSTPLISTGSATKLLTCQSNRLVDNSADARTMTANGEPNVQPFSPFSYTPTATVNTYGSYYFDGTGDYLTVENDAIDIGYDPFTVEIWAYLKDSSSFCPLWGISNGAGGALKINLYDSGNGSLTFENSGGGGNFSTDTGVRDIMNNAWAHIVFVREGTGTNQSHIYVNGVVRGTGTVSGNLTGWTGRFRFARNPEDYSSAMAGYISNARIIKNKALYTSAFTPPTKPIELTLTEGENSVYFDGSNDYFTVPNSTNTNIGGYSEDYTINCWFNLGTITSAHRVLFGMSNGGGAQNKWLVGINMSSTAAYSANKVGIYSYANSSARGDGTYSPGFLANSWYYFTLVYTHSNTTLKIYINGTEVVSVSSNVDSSTGAFTIGTDGEQNGDFIGYISNFRLVKGHALSAAVPEVPFDVTSGTVLLACASRYLEDRSPQKLNITNVDAVISQFNPFNDGYWSFYSDGAGFINSGANVTDTGSYTYEGWVKPTADNSGYAAIFATVGNFSSFPGVGLYANNSSPPRLHVRHGGTTQEDANGQLAYDTWYFVKVVYDSSAQTLTTFLDGTQIYQNSSISANAQGSNACLFYQPAAGNQYFHGYISNWRFRPVVDSSTTVPTEPFDPSVSNTEFLFQSNRFVNNGSTTGTIAITGTVAVDEDIPFTFLKRQTKLLNLQNNQSVGNNSIGNSTAFKTSFDTNGSKPFQGTFSPFSAEEGKWSVYLDGSGDYFVFTDNAALEVGSNDFTFEVWYLPLDVTSNNQGICDFGSQGSQASIIPFYQNGSSLVYYVTTAGGGWNTASGVSYGGTLVAGQWHHLALVRDGNTLTPYFNGVAGTTATISGAVNNSAVDKYVGAFTVGTGVPTGYISNFRLVNGTAVYTSAFTPPTKPLTAIANTSLLVCSSNAFVDKSTNNFSPTVYGTPKVYPYAPFAPSRSYSKEVVGGSAYFDATTGTGFTSLDNVPGCAFGTGDFTVEVWIYNIDGGVNGQIVSNRDTGSSGNANQWSLEFWSATTPRTLEWHDGLTAGILTATGVYPNQWNHIAVARSGTTSKMFVNGVEKSSATDSRDYSNVKRLNIGDEVNFTGASPFKGYIGPLRILKGTCLYTSAFTPPTSLFTEITNTEILINFTDGAVIDNTGKNNLETIDDARVSLQIKKFGNGSMYFDGTTDKMILPHSELQQLNTGQFTVELFVYFTATDARQGFFGNDGGWYFQIYDGELEFALGVSAIIERTFSHSLNQWYHLAATRDSSNDVRLFIDGTQQGAVVNSTANLRHNSNVFHIGNIGPNTTRPFKGGYMDEIRITKGVARYTSNFTVPTKAFKNR